MVNVPTNDRAINASTVEQIDAFIKSHDEEQGAEPQEKEVHARQEHLFQDMEKDLFDLYATELVVPLLGEAKKELCGKIIIDC